MSASGGGSREREAIEKLSAFARARQAEIDASLEAMERRKNALEALPYVYGLLILIAIIWKSCPS